MYASLLSYILYSEAFFLILTLEVALYISKNIEKFTIKI